MFVLGVDPGLSRCGYGGVEQTSKGPRAVVAGVITTPPTDALAARLAVLHDELTTLVAELGPQVVAVERLFFQTNARTAIAVGQASGLVLVAAHRAGCEIAQYTPNEVKQAVAGHGAASKPEVQRMVQLLLGLAVRPEPPDAADALGLALCHLAGARMRAGVGASR